MRISDWSSDVCSSDLVVGAVDLDRADVAAGVFQLATLHQPGWVEVVAPRHERPAADAGADAVDGLRRLRRGKQIVSHAPSTGRSCRTTTGGLRFRGRRSRVAGKSVVEGKRCHVRVAL